MDALRMDTGRTCYKSWIILISPIASGWQFSCCPANGEPITHFQEYKDCESALRAAKRFVDWMIIRCHIATVLDNLLETGWIRHRDHEMASRYVSLVFKRFSFGTSGDRIPPELPQQNHPDLSP